MSMFGMLQKAQEMQANLKKLQEELARSTFVGEAGGMVRVEMNGTHELTKVQIDPKAMAAQDVGLLEDLVLAAAKAALAEANAVAKQKMGALTGGLQIPGLSL
jgi:DNA-binding YbaB/EbfC family protein